MSEEALVTLESTGYSHGKPEEGLECMGTMEDITEEDGNFCEYQTTPSMQWHPSRYGVDIVRRLITSQFSEYLAGVRKADCEADLKRRIANGPPVWLEDKHALPIPEGDTHICRVWMAEDGKEYSAKLSGCVEVALSACPHSLNLDGKRDSHCTQGEERQVLWDELKSFLGTPEGESGSPAADEAIVDPATPLNDLKIS